MRKRPSRAVISAFTVLLALIGVSQTAKCSVIAYEGFNYDAGSSLDGLNGGTGFGDAWFFDPLAPPTEYLVINGSLTDPTGSISYSGNSIYNSGVQPRAARNVSETLGTTGTTIYCSFLLRQDSLGDFTEADHDFGGLILGGVNESNMLGVTGLYIGRGAYGSLSDKYVLGEAGDGDSEVGSGVEVVVGSTALLVARIDFLAGADKATLYVNPTPGGLEPVSGTVFTGVDLGAFSQLSITHGNHSAWTIDEIRLASTWSEVTIPEPSTFALALTAVLAALGIARVKRRRVTILDTCQDS